MAVLTQDVLGKPLAGWRLRLYTIIFEADTRAGRLFDQWLIAVILVSVAVVVADSVQGVGPANRSVFVWLEWIFTIAFTAMMLLGWGTLAVPTGIVTAEMTAHRFAAAPTTRTCQECLTEGHLPEANYCLHCGAALPRYFNDAAHERRQRV